MKKYLLLLYLFIGCTKIQTSDRVIDNCPRSLFFVVGDSNCGGTAVNGQLSTYELSPRTSTKIFNNYSKVFEPLDIGTNNLLQHQNLIDNSFHGIENGLANEADSGMFGAKPIHVLKGGSGGARITWFTDSTLINYGVNAWVQLRDRMDSALKLMSVINNGKRTPLVMILSEGVNDATSGNAAAWKVNVKTFIAKCRARWGNIMVFHLHLPTDNNGYDVAIDQLGMEISNYYPINTTGAALKNTNHWNHLGFKTIAYRIAKSYTIQYKYCKMVDTPIFKK